MCKRHKLQVQELQGQELQEKLDCSDIRRIAALKDGEKVSSAASPGDAVASPSF